MFIKLLASSPLPAHTHPPPSRGWPASSSQLQDKPGCPRLSSCVQGGLLRAPTVRQWPRSLVLPRPSQALLEGDKQPSLQRQVLLPIKHEQNCHEKPDPPIPLLGSTERTKKESGGHVSTPMPGFLPPSRQPQRRLLHLPPPPCSHGKGEEDPLTARVHGDAFALGLSFDTEDPVAF